MKNTIAVYNCWFPSLFRNKESYPDTNESISFHSSLTQSKQGSLWDNSSTKQQIECLNTFRVGWLRCNIFIYSNRDPRNLLVQQAHNRQGYCKLMQESNKVYIKKIYQNLNHWSLLWQSLKKCISREETTCCTESTKPDASGANTTSPPPKPSARTHLSTDSQD